MTGNRARAAAARVLQRARPWRRAATFHVAGDGPLCYHGATGAELSWLRLVPVSSLYTRCGYPVDIRVADCLTSSYFTFRPASPPMQDLHDGPFSGGNSRDRARARRESPTGATPPGCLSGREPVDNPQGRGGTRQ